MDKPKRIRIDKFLVDHGYFESRERAQTIDSGRSCARRRTRDRQARDIVKSDAAVRVIAEERYVGRGGYKLEAALDHFAINTTDLVCLDVGASTGGFTDCLLQRGARKGDRSRCRTQSIGLENSQRRTG